MQDDKKLIIPDYSLTSSGNDVQEKQENKDYPGKFKVLFVDDEESVLSSLKEEFLPN